MVLKLTVFLKYFLEKINSGRNIKSHEFQSFEIQFLSEVFSHATILIFKV